MVFEVNPSAHLKLVVTTHSTYHGRTFLIPIIPKPTAMYMDENDRKNGSTIFITIFFLETKLETIN